MPQPSGPIPGASFPTGQLVLHKADVADRQACHALVQEALNRFGRLDIIVHNAGIQFPEDPSTPSVGDHLEDVMRTNVYPLTWMVEEGMQALKGAGGSIIANTSINAYKGNDKLISYSASKGALMDLIRSYALALGKDGIRCNAVAPGPIWTPFITATFEEGYNRDKFGKATPMGRAGQPAECAPAFVFLASHDASYITGHAIHVDGGQWSSS